MAHIVTNNGASFHYLIPTTPPTRSNAEQRGATRSNNDQGGPIGGNCETKSQMLVTEGRGWGQTKDGKFGREITSVSFDGGDG